MKHGCTWIRSNRYLAFLRYLIAIGLLFVVALLGVKIAAAATISPGAAQLAQTNQLVQRLLAADPADPNRVYIGNDQTQDFFSPHGHTEISTDGAGHWSQIQLTDNHGFELGAVTLNMRIDMQHDFSFSWQVRLKKDPNASLIADGVGFALHPTYTADEVKAMGSTQGIAQEIHSIGLSGGNFGTADFMNAFGFKIDSWPNPGYPKGPMAGTFYGDPKHTPQAAVDAYTTRDDLIDGRKISALAFPSGTQWGPFGIFTQTDATGYMNATAADANQNGQPDQTPLTGQTGNAVNLLGGAWQNMQIMYTAATHRLTIILADPDNSTRTMTWSRTLTSAEINLINQKHYYAFTILGSTGSYWAEQSIQKLSGYFTPESPSLVVRQATTNGTSLALPTTITQSGRYRTKAPIRMAPTKDNNYFTGVLSHLLLTHYDTAGQQVTSRIDANAYGSDGNQWYFDIDPATYKSLTIVTYVYRRTASASDASPSAKFDIPLPKLSFSGTSTSAGTSGPYTVQPKSTVYVTAQLANPSIGPADWIKPTALITLPQLLQATAGPGVTQTGQQLTVQFADIARGTTGTVTFALTYSGQLPATLYPDQLPAGTGMRLALHGYLYDQSPDVINAAGARTDGSYFYVPTTLDAPKANSVVTSPPNFSINTTKDIDSGNFVPQFGSAQPAASAVFHYWDVTSADTNPQITTMDPILAGHPTTDIAGTAPGTLTGLLGNAIANAPQPTAPVGYQYLGYYEYTGSGTSSIWHSAQDTPTTFYYQVPTTGTSALAPQQIAYIYRPISDHYFSLTTTDLDFGRHPASAASHDLSLPTLGNVQTTLTDHRPSVGLPAASGPWQVSVAANGPLTGRTTQAVITGAQLVFAAADTGTAQNVTTAGGALALTDNASETLTLGQSSVYGSASLNWAPAKIQLNLPAQTITPDTYQTTITWTVTDGL